MSTFDDITPDDDPLDFEAVNADDAIVERLRHALSPDAAVVWDDNDDEDPGYALLRLVQLDVSADLPDLAIVPGEVTPLVPRRRHLSRGATIAVVAAGVLSIGGVAAASAPGQPLAGVRHAVSDAVASAVDAITPDAPVGPSVAESSRPASPSPKPTPPGDAVSDAARSAAAILQLEANLDRAEALLKDGRVTAAQAQLDAAGRKLGYVTDNDARTRLLSRLALLQAQLDAAPTTAPSHGPRDDKGKPAGSADTKSDGKGGGAASHAPTAPPAQSNRTQSSRVNNGSGISTFHTRVRLPGDAGGVGGRGNSDRR